MTVYDREEGRQCFLDVLRVAATCAVVLLHTITGVMDITDMNLYPLEKKVFLAALDLITWCVPVFLMISGYLFLNPNREITFMQMLKKYCRRIVFALFLFGIPYACLEQIMQERTFRVQMLGESVLLVLQGKTWSHMWYLYLILVLYLMTPAIKAILKKVPEYVLYIILTALFAGSSLMPYISKLLALEELPVLPDGGIYLFYYLCGYLFVRRRGFARENNVDDNSGNDNAEQNVMGEKGLSASASAQKPPYFAYFLTLLLALGMIASRLAGSYSVRMAYNYPFTVVLSLLLMWLAREAEGKLRKKNTVLWEKAGAMCFAVYLIHPFFVNVFYKLLYITPLSFADGNFPAIGLSLVFFFVVILLFSGICTRILLKIPGMRKHVL